MDNNSNYITYNENKQNNCIANKYKSNNSLKSNINKLNKILRHKVKDCLTTIEQKNSEKSNGMLFYLQSFEDNNDNDNDINNNNNNNNNNNYKNNNNSNIFKTEINSKKQRIKNKYISKRNRLGNSKQFPNNNNNNDNYNLYFNKDAEMFVDKYNKIFEVNSANLERLNKFHMNFKDLIKAYKEKQYRIDDVANHKNIFEEDLLLLENDKLHKLYNNKDFDINKLDITCKYLERLNNIASKNINGNQLKNKSSKILSDQSITNANIKLLKFKNELKTSQDDFYNYVKNYNYKSLINERNELENEIKMLKERNNTFDNEEYLLENRYNSIFNSNNNKGINIYPYNNIIRYSNIINTNYKKYKFTRSLSKLTNKLLQDNNTNNNNNNANNVLILNTDNNTIKNNNNNKLSIFDKSRNSMIISTNNNNNNNNKISSNNKLKQNSKKSSLLMLPNIKNTKLNNKLSCEYISDLNKYNNMLTNKTKALKINYVTTQEESTNLENNLTKINNNVEVLNNNINKNYAIKSSKTSIIKNNISIKTKNNIESFINSPCNLNNNINTSTKSNFVKFNNNNNNITNKYKDSNISASKFNNINNFNNINKNNSNYKVIANPSSRKDTMNSFAINNEGDIISFILKENNNLNNSNGISSLNTNNRKLSINLYLSKSIELKKQIDMQKIYTLIKNNLTLSNKYNNDEILKLLLDYNNKYIKNPNLESLLSNTSTIQLLNTIQDNIKLVNNYNVRKQFKELELENKDIFNRINILDNEIKYKHFQFIFAINK